MSEITGFPSQTLSFSRKNKAWRKRCVDWAVNKSFFNYNLVRKSILHKKINYDLINGILHKSDMVKILNPDSIEAGYIPDDIQHYPIINSKLYLLRGEESKRVFDCNVIITNPTGISEKQNQKKEELFEALRELIENTALSEDQLNTELARLDDYYTYSWKDIREVRANALLNHYRKEQNLDVLFNTGFMDAMTIGEEMYQIDIVGGEPLVTRLNPIKTLIFSSGFSNKVEDADMIILEDYWSAGRIIDNFYDVLSSKDIEHIEKISTQVGAGGTDSLHNTDPRLGVSIVNGSMMTDELTVGEPAFNPENIFNSNVKPSLLPFDMNGNIRVIKLYWKSRRRIKKVKSYDVETGEEVYNFYPEDYIINEEMGEEETILFINEAWEGTKIGESIYVNMRPKPVQYNRLSNPSRCHFGIIGSIYNLNENKPYSLVDMMKPYNYLFNAVHDRLNKAMANNWGPIMDIDLAKIPEGWTMDQWLYFAKVNKLAVKDSFREGNRGASMGKLAATLNNASSGGINLDSSAYIQQLQNILEYIKLEMAEVSGVSKQREGQVSNRETVGGVERATLQSSHITEWLFITHDDVKKRVLECLLETAKIAMRGRTSKFQYLMGDGQTKLIEIDGDQFAECDYGLVIDNSSQTQELKQNINQLAQAALQNQLLSFSTIAKLFSSSSMAEKQRMIEIDENKTKESQSQQAEQDRNMQMQMAEHANQAAMQEMELRDSLNARDNDTKLQIAQLQSMMKQLDTEDFEADPNRKEELLENIRQYNESLKLERDKFNAKKSFDDKKLALENKKINKLKATRNESKK